MKLDEALAWLNGERSSWNQHAQETDGLAQCAIEDAARTQQAYWIAKAHAEQLIRSAPAPETLREMAEWFDDPKRFRDQDLRTKIRDSYYTPGYLLRQIADQLPQEERG